MTTAHAAARYLLTPVRLLILLPALLAGLMLVRTRELKAPTENEAWDESDRLWKDANKDIDLTVVMPFYNPGAALAPTVRKAVVSLQAAGIGYEIIAVSDGSTDGSEKTIEGIEGVRVITLDRNRGKGAALHAGFARARGSYIGFVDSDGDIDPSHLVGYYSLALEGEHDIVFANKKHQHSQSASSPVRKLVSFGFSTLVEALFGLGVNDTQTGCKVVRRGVMADVLPRLRETRFAFDLELFVAAASAGYHNHMLEELRQKAPEGLEVLGRVEELDKNDRMHRAHLHVATSIREGWGLVVSEAAAWGTPTLAYDNPGLRDSTMAAGGQLCPPNPKALAAFMVQSLQGSSLEKYVPPAYGGAASWDEVADSVIAYLRTLAPELRTVSVP